MSYLNYYAQGGPMEGAPSEEEMDPTLGPQDTMGTPPEAGAAGDPNGGDTAAQIEQALSQYQQSRDPQLAVQICDMMVQAQQSMGGGQPAPAEGMQGADPNMQDPNAGAPVGRNGMALPSYKNGGQIPTSRPLQFVKRK